MSTNVLAEFQKAGDPGQLDLTVPVAPIEVTLTSKNKSILDKLRSKHEHYDIFHSKWAFYMDSFEGGEDFITEKNIFRHVRENIDDHRDRVERAVYLNYVQPLVSFFSNFIFSEEIMRTGGTNAELYSKFTKDVDDQGNKMELFMKEVSDLTQIFGHVDILVDKKQIPVELRGADVRISKKQEEDLGLDKPYLVILYPEEVYDWNLVNGKFTYLKRCIKEKDVETYTEWFPEAVVITTVTRLDPKKETYSIKREVIENILKEVPIVRAYFKQSKKYKGMGISFLKDISYICRRIMNLSSLLDEFLYRQCTPGYTLIDCPRDLEKYPDGIPIKDLVGKDFSTYSWDNDNRKFVIRRAYDVRQTGTNRELYRLTFDYKDEYNQIKYGTLDATPDHLVLLQSGEYVQLKDLKAGDKLVPFYRWMDGWPRGNRPHILQTLNPYSGIAEHRFIVRERDGELLKGYDIHHVDERSLNNYPENLQQITKEEHNLITKDMISERKKAWWKNVSEDDKKTLTEKALAGINRWRKKNPAKVKACYKKQSNSIKKTLSRLSADERRAKVAAALEARGIKLGDVNHSVVSVEFLGYDDVYNFEVEGTHNYVANGIVIHNCYNFLAKEADSGVPLVDQNEGNQGTSNVMEYPRGGKAPQYVSPPVDPAEFLQSEIKSNILEIYRLASQDTALEAFTGQSRSGDAQVQSFHKVIPYIAIRAEGLEQTEIKLTKLWLKWIDPTLTWDGTIAYKNDYGILNVTQFLIQLKMLFSDIGIPSVTFVREEMKRIVQEFDGKISQENIKSIFSEIDKLVTEDYVQSMVAAKKSINNLKGVPGTTQIQQGTVQKTLGNNTLISAVGANKVVETRKDKEFKNKNRTSNNNKSQ